MRVCPTRVNTEVRVLRMESSTTTANVCPTSLPVTAMCCSTVSLITFSFFMTMERFGLFVLFLFWF